MTLLDDRVDATSQDFDFDITHWVCHCTNDNIAACGLDVTEMNLEQGYIPNEQYCALCVLAWPENSPCPWGCECHECKI